MKYNSNSIQLKACLITISILIVLSFIPNMQSLSVLSVRTSSQQADSLTRSSIKMGLPASSYKNSLLNTRSFRSSPYTTNFLHITSYVDELPCDMVMNETWGIGMSTYGEAVVCDSKDNMYVTGASDVPNSEEQKGFLIKYNKEGVFLWNTTWQDTAVEITHPREITIDNQDKVYVVGSEDNNISDGTLNAVLYKFDSNGTRVWKTSWRYQNRETCAYAVTVDMDDNIYVTGGFANTTWAKSGVFITKFTPAGQFLWERLWGGEDYDLPLAITSDDSNAIYVTGATQNYREGTYEPTFLYNDVFLLKYNHEGTLLWERFWGGYDRDAASDIVADRRGNIFITGNTESYAEAGSDVFLIKYRPSGELVWNKTWGGSEKEEAFSVALNSDNDIYVTAWFQHPDDVTRSSCILKYGQAGHLQWYQTLDCSPIMFFSDMYVDSSSNVNILGTGFDNAGRVTMWIFKYKIQRSLLDQQLTLLFRNLPFIIMLIGELFILVYLVRVIRDKQTSRSANSDTKHEIKQKNDSNP